MSVFAISDLHLSLGTNKPMNVFGAKWNNYEDKLKENWNNTIKPEDFVILNGDHSWAMYIKDAFNDFSFINSLNGTKFLSKGNHDYWWTTMNKQVKFCEENDFSTLNFLQNNSYFVNDYNICGTRGWLKTTNNEEDKKIYNRELLRLELSINEAIKQNDKPIICALHYPPDSNFCKIMEKYNVKTCVYGHLHNITNDENILQGTINNIEYRLVSCDYLNFMPIKLI